VSASVLYMSMSLDGYIAGPNDQPGNPGGDGFMRLHERYFAGGESGRPHRRPPTSATASVTEPACQKKTTPEFCSMSESFRPATA